MIKLTEKLIEDLIYDAPWLLDERLLLPNIKGSRGQNGRQINVGNGTNKYIDLLLKNTKNNRPVIVEIKKGPLKRENIAQILEYRTMLLLLNEEQKEEWQLEFGNNFYAPELLLIVETAIESDVISANLTGIEVKVFGNTKNLDIGFDSIKDLRTKIKEWNDFRKSGNRTLIDRVAWYEEIIEKITHIIEPFDLTTITKPQNIKRRRNEDAYIDSSSPFLNIPINYNDNCLLGIFEYFDETLPFDDKYFYVDFGFVFSITTIKDDKDWEDVKVEIQKIKSEEISLIDFDISHATFKVERQILGDNKGLKKVLELLIIKGIEIFNMFYKTED